MNKKIVYITGCLGFMASYFVKSCLLKEWYVIGIDKIDSVSNINLLTEFKKYKNFKFIKEDINNLTDLYECDFIVNFAASSHVDKSLNSSKQFLHDNVNGVYNLLELIRNTSKEIRPTLIHISTDETLGDIAIGSHLETDMLKPSNPYAASKSCGDQLILAWARTYDLSYNIIRPTNNYGIYQYPEKLIPRVCKSLQLGKKIPLHNNGTPRRTWLHAQDTTDGILTVIDKGVRNEIYNISGNYEDSNINVVSKIINCFLNRNIETKLTESEMSKFIDFSFNRPGVDVRYSLNDDKLKMLRWNCNKIFDKELINVVNFYKETFIW